MPITHTPSHFAPSHAACHHMSHATPRHPPPQVNSRPVGNTEPFTCNTNRDGKKQYAALHTGELKSESIVLKA